jgi:hypothetical protein
MNALHRFVAALLLLALGAAATAQSTSTMSQTGPQAGMREARVQAGIVIPFGRAGTTTERAPRLEMWSDHGRDRNPAPQSLRSDADPGYGQPLRFGVTLGSEPRMMVNGREMPGQSDRRNVSALGWVGITVGVAALVVGAAVLGAFGSFST